MAFKQITMPRYTLPTPIIAGIGSAVFLLTGVFLGYQYFFASGTSQIAIPDYTEMYTVHAQASDFARNGDRMAAQAALTQFLSESDDPIVQARTKTSMARNISAVDIEEAVALYKELASDETKRLEDRAAAIEEMALMHVLNFTSDPDAVTRAIFSDEPYVSIYSEAENDRDAYIHLFKYANSISPRMLGSAYIALDAAKKYEASGGADQDLKSTIDTNLSALDALIASAPDTDEYKPLALILRGLIGFSLSPTPGYELENAKNFIRQGMDTSEFFIAALQTAFEAEGIDASRYDFNRSYFGEGYLWEVVFVTFAEIQDIDASILAEFVDEYIAYANSEKGSREIVRITEFDAPIVPALSVFADQVPELQLFLEEQGIISEFNE